MSGHHQHIKKKLPIGMRKNSFIPDQEAQALLLQAVAIPWTGIGACTCGLGSCKSRSRAGFVPMS